MRATVVQIVIALVHIGTVATLNGISQTIAALLHRMQRLVNARRQAGVRVHGRRRRALRRIATEVRAFEIDARLIGVATLHARIGALVDVPKFQSVNDHTSHS